MCVCVCIRACMRACVCACVRACVRAEDMLSLILIIWMSVEQQEHYA